VCPTGWRVPTEQDFKDLNLGSAQDGFEQIKLSVAGYRNHSTGSIYDVDAFGSYWTSSVDGDKSRNLSIDSGGTHFGSNNRSFGFSVRCVKHLVD